MQNSQTFVLYHGISSAHLRLDSSFNSCIIGTISIPDNIPWFSTNTCLKLNNSQKNIKEKRIIYLTNILNQFYTISIKWSFYVKNGQKKFFFSFHFTNIICDDYSVLFIIMSPQVDVVSLSIQWTLSVVVLKCNVLFKFVLISWKKIFCGNNTGFKLERYGLNFPTIK